MCSRSAVNTGRPLMNLRRTESEVSSIGRPKDTTGIATAMIIGAFCTTDKTSALTRKIGAPQTVLADREFSSHRQIALPQQSPVPKISNRVRLRGYRHTRREEKLESLAAKSLGVAEATDLVPGA